MNNIVKFYLAEFHRSIWPVVKEGFNILDTEFVEYDPNVPSERFKGWSKKGAGWVLMLSAKQKGKKDSQKGIPVFFSMANEALGRRVWYELDKGIKNGVMLQEPVALKVQWEGAKESSPKKQKRAKPKPKPKKSTKGRKR